MTVHNQIKMLAHEVWKGIKPDPVVVSPGEVYRLHDVSHIIHILSGSAWITFDDKDMVVEKGRNLYLPASQYPTLLSAVGKTPVVFQVQRRAS